MTWLCPRRCAPSNRLCPQERQCLCRKLACGALLWFQMIHPRFWGGVESLQTYPSGGGWRVVPDIQPFQKNLELKGDNRGTVFELFAVIRYAFNMLSNLPKRTIGLSSRGFGMVLGWAFLSALLLASPAHAYRILFYHNSLDGTEGALLKCVSILQEAGHQVSVVDVKGRGYDPTGDNWGAPYDQVWDMRFTDRDSPRCGSGIPQAPDYFGVSWRNKAVSYLNHCGKLFIAAEHYQLADRNEGLYRFLEKIQAVKKGYDPCPPSSRGNSTTNGPEVYPVKNGLGPVSFFGAYVGGIPLDVLTGTSYIDPRRLADGRPRQPFHCFRLDRRATGREPDQSVLRPGQAFHGLGRHHVDLLAAGTKGFGG
jgi:hypothetical protein